MGTRVPAVVVSGYELSIETIIDASWEYNRRQYELWRIFDPWPAGFLLHVAGPAEDTVPVQAIWRNYEVQSQYMADVGVHRFTEVVRVMTEEHGGRQAALADVEPVHRKITHLGFGPLALGFIDIGPDLDESAGRQLGTVLTAIDIKIEALNAASTDELWRKLRLVEQIDTELIMRLQETEDSEGNGDLRETQVWSSEAAARRFVDDELFPQLRDCGVAPEAFPEIEFREIRRLAISSAELDPRRFAEPGPD